MYSCLSTNRFLTQSGIVKSCVRFPNRRTANDTFIELPGKTLLAQKLANCSVERVVDEAISTNFFKWQVAGASVSRSNSLPLTLQGKCTEAGYRARDTPQMSEARSYLLPCNIFMVASLREPKAFARELGIFSTANSSASHVAAYVSRPRTALRSSNHAIRELCRSLDHGAACRTGKEIGGSKRRRCRTHLDYVLSSFGKSERVPTSVSSRRRRNSSFLPNRPRKRSAF